MKYILIVVLFFLVHSLEAQDKINYSSLAIPDSLKKNAEAVYILREGLLDISSPSHYTLKVHEVISILNAEGAHHLRHGTSFNKFMDIDEYDVIVYNSLGIVSKKYNRKDFQTQALYDGETFFSDAKVMRLYTPSPGYPCTVEIEYTINFKSYLDLPDWYFDNANSSIVLSRYIVTVPNDLDIRYQAINSKIEAKVEQLEKKKKYTWEAKNIVAPKYQDGGYETHTYLPRIMIAPNLFEFDGYKGAFRTWNDFGKWNYQLYQETSPFSKERTEEIKNMVSRTQDPKEKISILYDYLQRNFRYVSIQLGIGGFKPFPVKFVDEKKYGDCKALTNYMRHLLQAVGITSYPALINAGYDSRPADPLFPSDPFNHVILCIPNKTDSIWLECTSNDNEAGFLGSSTENKNALLLTESGGILVKTPRSTQEKNNSNSYTEIVLGEDGSARTKVQIISSGDALSIFRYIKLQNNDDQKDLIVNYLNYTAPDEFMVKESVGQDKKNVTQMDFTFQKLYEFKAGTKYFFPQKLNKLVARQLKDEVRTTDYVFKFPFLKHDTTVFILPVNFTANELPANKDLQNEFASYKKQVEYNKDTKQLKIITSFGIKQHIIPAKSYQKVVQLFKEVQQDESEKLVLVSL